jgi:hypothetical protein
MKDPTTGQPIFQSVESAARYAHHRGTHSSYLPPSHSAAGHMTDPAALIATVKIMRERGFVKDALIDIRDKALDAYVDGLEEEMASHG